MKAKKILGQPLLLLTVFAFILSMTACTPSEKNENSSGTAQSSSETTSFETGSKSGETNAGNGDSKVNTSGSGSKNTAASTNNQSNSTTATKAEPVNVKGYTFTLMSPWLPSKLSSNCTGFEKILFQRISEVQKEMGCTIKIVNSMDATFQNLQPLILSGKKVGDAVEILSSNVLSFANAGYIIPWDNVPGVNIKDSKYISGYTKMAAYDGKSYGLQFMKPPEVRMCVVFNKTLLRSKGVNADSLYTLASKKEWTFDKLKEYAKKTTTVVNGVTTTYGLGGTPTQVARALIRSNGGTIVTYKNGKATATYTSDSVKYAMNFINELVNTDKVYMTTSGMSNESTFNNAIPDYVQKFSDGKIGFLIAESWVINQEIKPKTAYDYGMLPVPIGPNASSYITDANNARVFVMTSTNAKNADYSKSIAIFNALSRPPKGYEGNGWWEYDIKKEYFQSKSQDKDLEMYIIGLNSAHTDVGWSVTALNTDFTKIVINGSIFWGQKTPSAAIDSLKGIYDKTIDSIFE